MKLRSLLLVVMFSFSATAVSVAQTKPAPQTRQVRPLDENWKFLPASNPGTATAGAESVAFDDTSWRTVTVPHDWSIAGPVAQTNPSGQGGGYFPAGVAWYRRTLAVPVSDAHRHVFVVFDGVMANSDVWINGFHLGHRPNGYVSFVYDLTGHLNFGARARNVLAVRCDTSQQPASRWYEGGGLYRHVRLVSVSEAHIAPWGTVVTTPNVTADTATVHIRASVTNESDKPITVSLRPLIESPQGNHLAGDFFTSAPAVIAPHSSADLDAETTIRQPDRWDIAHPALYNVRAFLMRDGKIVDEEQVAFGIREFHFDADTGFWLNGNNFKLKGAAMHADGGAVGIAVPTAVYERRLLALRALGVNAIRTAHNPPSPEFLDLCDRLGFLVMDEMFDQWTVAKNPFDYHLYFRDWSVRDTADTVRRDRNHPSIILWSAGNEIHDTPHAEIAIPILKSLVETFHANDATRPVTQALFRPNVSHDYDNGLADLLDVVGQNYREQEILAAHAQKPTRKIVGTENSHDRTQWVAMRDHPEYSGQFIWAGIDYLGEAGMWPRIVNGEGLLDRTAQPRALALQRQSWWLAAPNIHMVRRIGAAEQAAIDPGYEAVPPRFRKTAFPDWTPANPAPHTEQVELYTNCEEAELLLNGRSLGRQPIHADATPLTWKVPFEAGTLKAVGYNGGKEVTMDSLRTAGAPARLTLTPQRNSMTVDANDVLTFDVAVTDANGVVVPNSSALVRFSVRGPGIIAATDNGNLSDHDSFQLPEHHAFEGRAIVLVRATARGALAVTVSADGLTPASASVNASAAVEPKVVRSF